MLPKRRGRPKKFVRKIQHITINKVQKKMRSPKNGLKLEGSGQRRITLASKKEYKSFSIIK